MKKTAAILLIALYFFISGGYRVLFFYVQQETNERLESKLDNNDYQEADLVEFTVPLNLPYQNDWTDFKRKDGEIVINGILYHFVKQKVKSNQLIIKCIANTEKKYILNQQEDFFKSINGLQLNKSDNKAIASSEKVSLINSIHLLQHFFQLNFNGSRRQLKLNYYGNCNFETTRFFYIPEQPPEAAFS